MGDDNYDAYKCRPYGNTFFNTDKSHETRHYFYKQAVSKSGFDPLARFDETELFTLSKEQGFEFSISTTFFLEISNPGKDECRMILEGLKGGPDLKKQMKNFLDKNSKLTRSFEILVSCDLHDDKGTRIKWAGGSPSDNMKCGECDMWSFDGGMCGCDGRTFDGGFNGYTEWQNECGDEPVNYRNGIIMKLQTSKVGKNNVVQVKYAKIEINRKNEQVVLLRFEQFQVLPSAESALSLSVYDFSLIVE